MICHQDRWLLLSASLIVLSRLGYAAPASKEPNCEMAVRAGDVAYAKFDNRAAFAEYRQAAQLDSCNYEALWKLARAYIDVGMSLPKKEKPQYYFMAEKTARRCATLHPDSAEGHFFSALAKGRFALFVGGKRKIQIARDVKAEAERALQINPKHYGALHVLARWHYELAGLNFIERAVAKIIFGGLPAGASYEKAARYFEQTIALNPNGPVHRLDYGRTLFKLRRLQEARRQLETCIALPDLFWDDPRNKLEARKLLDKIIDS